MPENGLKMKALHIINITTFGGAENLLIPFLPALANKGINVSCAILCPGKTPEAAKKIRDDLKEKGITVYYKEFRSSWERSNFKWISKIINETGADIIHSHLRHPEAWVVALKIFGRLQKPVVATAHGYNDRYMNRYGLKMVWKAYFSGYYWVTRLVSKKIDGFIYVSNCIKKFYKQASFGKNKPDVVIPHGYPQQPAEENSPIKKMQHRIVTWGRIVERKGYSYAVKALKLVKENFKEAELHILGMGAFQNKLQDMVEQEGLSGCVFFHGYKNDILPELKQYDVALLPSYWEPFGLVFLDAFAARIPVVAFDLPAGNEIIHHNQNGLLAIPYDAKDLAKKIEMLFENPALRNDLVQNGLYSLRSAFSMDIMADRHISFYSSLIENDGKNKKKAIA